VTPNPVADVAIVWSTIEKDLPALAAALARMAAHARDAT
jgi:uncharacterized protein with HEPN domain